MRRAGGESAPTETQNYSAMESPSSTLVCTERDEGDSHASPPPSRPRSGSDGARLPPCMLLNFSLKPVHLHGHGVSPCHCLPPIPPYHRAGFGCIHPPFGSHSWSPSVPQPRFTMLYHFLVRTSVPSANSLTIVVTALDHPFGLRQMTHGLLVSCVAQRTAGPPCKEAALMRVSPPSTIGPAITGASSVTQLRKICLQSYHHLPCSLRLHQPLSPSPRLQPPLPPLSGAWKSGAPTPQPPLANWCSMLCYGWFMFQ